MPPGLIPPLLDPGPFTELFEGLAMGGEVLRSPPSWVPNRGVGVRPYPTSFAPTSAIQYHVAKDQRFGRVVVLPLAVVQKACADDRLDLHTSPAFIAPKRNNDFGRLVINFSASGPNSDEKPALLAAKYGSIQLPSVGIFARLLRGVQRRFPNDHIFIVKTDFDSWYKRLALAVDSMPLLAFMVGDLNGVPHVAIPIVEQFGVQEASFHADYGSRLIHQHMANWSMQRYGIVTGSIYTDDGVYFTPPREVEPHRNAIGSFAINVAGAEILQRKKDVLAEVAEVLGYVFNVPFDLLYVSPSAFLKLLAIFFHEIPLDIQPGFLLAIRLYQRVSSLAIRASECIPTLKWFVKSFSMNLRGVHASATTAPLSPQAYTDILMWRHILWLAVVQSDASFLGTSIDTAIWLLRDPSESKLARALRHESTADYIIHVDACKDSRRIGIGSTFRTQQNRVICGWQSFSFSDFSHYWVDGVLCDVPINLLECFAFVSAIVSFVTDILPAFVSPRVVQVHVWSDNTSTLAWVSKCRAMSPTHAFLLQVLGHVTLRSNIRLTSGHIPGIENDFADATSREFDCPNGAAILFQLQHYHRLTPSQHLRDATVRVSQMQSTDTCHVARLALITSALVTGKLFVNNSTSIPF
jgi:hypothetical protein